MTIPFGFSGFPGGTVPTPNKPKNKSNNDKDDEPPVPPELPTFKDIAKNPFTITFVGIALIVGIIYFFSQTWTEALWFQQLGASRVLWTRWGTQIALFLLGFCLVFTLLLWVLVSAYKRRPRTKKLASSLREYQKIVDGWRKLLAWIVPTLFAIMAGIQLSSSWQIILQWFGRTSFGEYDPQFGIDIGFYVFTLPVLEALSTFFLTVLLWTLVAAVVVNFLYGGISLTTRLSVTKFARRQLGLLAAVTSVIIGWRYLLSIWTMLTDEGDLVDGALYTDIHANLPANVILSIISVLVAIMFVIASFKGRWILPTAGVAVTVVAALVIGVAYPALIEQFRVTPNARQLEEPYIQRNIDATLAAYGLDELEYQTYAAETTASAGQLREDSESTSQIRLLDPSVISPTFRQLQQSRPYYTFADTLTVDRYEIDGELRDTVIAVRDINLDGLQDEQQTWVNLHTVYTHGFGVVAAYGNTTSTDGTPAFWESSIPSQGELGDYEPRVYFSANSPDYSIVGAPEGAAPQELDYPDDNADSGQVQTTYSGDGGPSVGNWWNKLLYAVKFGSTDLFFSSQTNSESQILYDRDPLLRVSKVAPFLTLDQTAYPAVVDMDGDDSTAKRLVWIVDAYTTSNYYPYSEHQTLDSATTDSRTTATGSTFNQNQVNYMRNSVKAVVDAYDGSVTLYAWDGEDPILQAWSNIYPDLIQPMSEISGDLMSHLRYPQDLFKVQRDLLATYHVTEATEFYTGGDRWRLSEDPTVTETTTTTTTSTGETVTTTSDTVQAPYYLTMQMPGQESATFSLTSVYVPSGGGESRRAAMAGFLAVDSETGNQAGQVAEGYGQLRLIALPSSTTVPGPGQVQNNFNTAQDVASALNLLNQQGSTVIHGNLLTLPVGGGLLYVQPVYVQSTGSTSYPVLRYVLTAFGDQIGFATTLAESLDQIFGGDSAAEVADPGSTGSSTSTAGVDDDDGGGGNTTQTLEQQLSEALAAAESALADAEQAMQDGDWTAYGEAQSQLSEAIAEAVEIQSQLDGTGSSTGETAGSASESGEDTDASSSSDSSGTDNADSDIGTGSRDMADSGIATVDTG